MTALKHPNVEPPLVIEVEDESAVADHVASGWLVLDGPGTDAEPDTDTAPDGEGPDSEEEI